MKNLLLFLCSLLHVLLGHSQTKEKIITQAQGLEELQMIKTTLEEGHPGLNFFNQKDQISLQYQKVKEKLEKNKAWDEIEFFRLVNPLIVALQDGHMKFMPHHSNYPFYFNESNVLPFIVRLDSENRLVIVAAQASQYKGQFLESINGQDSEKLIEKIKANIIIDGKSEGSLAQLEQYFSAWYSNFIDNPESFKVRLKDSQGNSSMADLKGIDYVAWKELDAGATFLPSKMGFMILEPKIALLRIPNFMHPKKAMNRFYEQTFKSIRASGVEHLIIDVRGNEGGYDRLGKDLYSYLATDEFRYYDKIMLSVNDPSQYTYRKSMSFSKFASLMKLFIRKDSKGRYYWKRHANFGIHQPNKLAFTGRTWILQDGLSFSATTEFLSRVKADGRATLVGSQTGGTYRLNSSGTFVFLNLPYSKFTLAHPMGGYYMAVPEAEIQGQGIMPDVEVRPTLDDLIKKKDVVLETVLGMIQRKTAPKPVTK